MLFLFFAFLYSTLALSQENNVWMGSLSLSLLPDGGTFTMHGYAHEDRWVALPGETGTWPYSVQEGDNHLLIIDKEGIPHTLLTKGHHTIEGVFSWVHIPKSIKTPTHLGIITAHQNQVSIPIWRAGHRTWLSPDALPLQSETVERFESTQGHQTTLSIHSDGPAHTISIPRPETKTPLVNIETTSPYWYKNNTLHMYLSSGQHHVTLTTKGEKRLEKKTTAKLHIHRIIHSTEDAVLVEDFWKGDRDGDLLVYPENPTILAAGSTPVQHRQYQSKNTPLSTPINPEYIESTHTTIIFPGHHRVFVSFPILNIFLCLLTALLLWKDHSIKQRRLLLFSTLLCIIISPFAILFCICWIALQSLFFHNASKEHIKIRALGSLGIFAGIVMLNISPMTTHITEINDIVPSLYWIESPVLFMLSIIATSIFAFVLYKNMNIAVLLLIFAILPRSSFAQSGFPLCSVSLEDEVITISGQVHQAQEGEWFAPGPIGSIQVEQIIVDGEEFYAFRKTEDRFLALFLPQGISEFKIHGTYRSPFGLQFPQQASRLDFSSSTHQIEGLEEDHSHQKTLFFWKKTSPDTIIQNPTLHMNVYVAASQTTIKYTITQHKGTKIYHQPSWYHHNQELETKATHQVFPSSKSHTWEERFPTPSAVSFSVPQSNQYEYRAQITCAEHIVCTKDNALWNKHSPWYEQQSISIQQQSTKERLPWIQSSWNASLGFWKAPTHHSKIVQVINHTPDTIFIVLESPHITYISMCLLFCLGCSFLLAKYTSSPLNFMEWLWISTGSYTLHPLALPYAILCILGMTNRWMKYLCLIGLAIIAYTTTLGSTTWLSDQTVIAIHTDLAYQGLCVWLLGAFFFLHTLKLPQKSMKVGGSQT